MVPCVRALAVVLLLVGSLALAGCSSDPDEPNSAVDPEKAESSDYVRASLVVGVLLIVVAGIVGAVILVRRRRRDEEPGAGPRKGKSDGP